LTSSLNFSCSWFSSDDEDANSNDTITEITSDDTIDNSSNEAYVADDYQIPDELIYNKQSDNFLIDKLYPIGWSKDGKFAYIIENLHILLNPLMKKVVFIFLKLLFSI